MERAIKSKELVCLLLIAACITSGAQNKWKKYLFTGASQFTSGFLDGTVESISYHYENGFKLRVPNANDQFWNPAISWKNKYKNGDSELGPRFAGSTTLFVSTTDAYHLLRTGKRSIDGLTLAYYVNKECSGAKAKEFTSKKRARKKWMSTGRDFLMLTAIRCAGFHLSYSFLFRRQTSL